MPKPLFGELNENQKEAVLHAAGPSLVLAGAGSGKTRVLVAKVLHMIQELAVPSEHIVMITFTNKAAREMKERINNALGAARELSFGYIGTFHSFCCQILRRDGHHIGLDRGFTIFDSDDQLSIIKRVLKKTNAGKLTPSYFLNKISDAKNQLITPDRYLEVFSFYRAPEVAEVYEQYQNDLRKNNGVDFDDLIMMCVQLYTKYPEVLNSHQNRYRYLLVDEFQDTNYAQYVFTRLLAQKHSNITAVGDFSQSIYSWRGADIRNLEKFSSDFPEAKVIYLEENYRSTQTILDYAYQVISKNQSHPILRLTTANDVGDGIEFYEAENEEDEARFISRRIQEALNDGEGYTSCAVLYRVNAQSRAIEEALLHDGIPYTLIGGVRFYERKEVKDVLSYLRLFVNPRDEISAERIIKMGKRHWNAFKECYARIQDAWKELTTTELMERIFDATGYLNQYDPDVEEGYARLENLRELKSVAEAHPDLVVFLEQVALVESEYSEGEKRGKSREGVRLMTLHQAKGLEFPVVFIAGLEEGILPHSRSIDDVRQLEEERRLFYVGITRAMKKLYITHAQRRYMFGRRTEALKSRFIRTPDDDFIEGCYF